MKEIKLVNLKKNYGKLTAIKNVNLKLEKGKVYGLLGRNGAGKSTLLRTITDRINITEGEIYFDGKQKLTDEERAKIFFTEPDSLIPEDARARDLFKFASNFQANFNIDEALQDAEMYGLNVNRKYGQLSTGYQSILRSILALNSHEDFVFLDEPTLGFDVISRDIFYRHLLEKYSEDNNSIVLSTHLIDEVAPLIEEVIFIDKGEIILIENTESLLERHAKISGFNKDIQDSVAGLKVLDTRQGQQSTTVIVEVPYSELKLNDNLQVSKVSLQELFVAIVKR